MKTNGWDKRIGLSEQEKEDLGAYTIACFGGNKKVANDTSGFRQLVEKSMNYLHTTLQSL